MACDGTSAWRTAATSGWRNRNRERSRPAITGSAGGRRKSQASHPGTRGSDEAWEGVEQPRLQDWCSGLEIGLGPDGTRLRRYEMAADRLFRSAWTKLERLRKESGEPFIQHCEPGFAAEHTARPAPPAVPISEPVPRAPAPVRPESAVPAAARLDDSSPVLDFWIGGPPRPGINPGCLFQNKTNPTPSRPAHGGRAARRRNLP